MKNIKVKTLFIGSKKNKTGECPIYLRISLSGRQTNLSTGIFLKSEFCDQNKKVVKARY